MCILATRWRGKLYRFGRKVLVKTQQESWKTMALYSRDQVVSEAVGLTSGQRYMRTRFHQTLLIEQILLVLLTILIEPSMLAC